MAVAQGFLQVVAAKFFQHGISKDYGKHCLPYHPGSGNYTYITALEMGRNFLFGD
jgi:hypothetical protein